VSLCKKRAGGEMSFEGFLAVVLAKVLGISGIGGFVAGLFVRSFMFALTIGAVCGIFSTIILMATRVTGVDASSWVIAIFVGSAMAALGWAIRGRKIAR